MDQDETWQSGRPWPWPHCVRWGPSSPSPKRGSSPPFLAHICCDQMPGWIKMPLGTEVGLSPSDIALDGDPAPLPQKGAEPPVFGPCLLWPNGRMDHDGTWYGRRPRPSDIVLDGNPAPPKRCTAPDFGPYLLWPYGWMDEDSTWYGSTPHPRPHCVTETQLPPTKGAQQPPLFGPCLLWPRSPTSAIVLVGH